jgi:hypothetical protein
MNSPNGAASYDLRFVLITGPTTAATKTAAVDPERTPRFIVLKAKDGT